MGDRVLGLVIAVELLARYPQEKEGDLARRQAELVSRRICAEIAAEVNLDAVIRCDPGQRGGGGAPELKRVQLVVDGANVGWNYGQANGLGYFSAAGVVCTSRPNP